MITFESIKKEHKDKISFKEEYILVRDLLFKLIRSVLSQFEKETELPACKFYDKLIRTKYLNKYCTDISESWVSIRFEIRPRSFFKPPITIDGVVCEKDSECRLKLSIGGSVDIDHLKLLNISLIESLNKYFLSTEAIHVNQ